MKNKRSSRQEPGTHVNPVPNLFTLCNALCGFSSILLLLAAPGTQIPTLCLWLIGGAIFFDMLDGLTARTLHAQSTHGIHLDSMADAISFGLTPAVILYQACQHTSPDQIAIAWIASAIYLCSALWRLAEFNTSAIRTTHDHHNFNGLPTPGAAGLICCSLIFASALNLSGTLKFSIYLTYAMICSLLMISPLKYPHLMHRFTGENPWNRLGILALILSSLILFKQWALIAGAHLYVLHTPLTTLRVILIRYTHKMHHADTTSPG